MDPVCVPSSASLLRVFGAHFLPSTDYYVTLRRPDGGLAGSLGTFATDPKGLVVVTVGPIDQAPAGFTKSVLRPLRSS